MTRTLQISPLSGSVGPASKARDRHRSGTPAAPHRSQAWRRLALIGSGLLIFAGGSPHATEVNNSAQHKWASTELLVLIGVALLVAGLGGLRRQPCQTRGSPYVGAATLGVASFGIEAAFHLFPYVDTDQLGTGDLFAPIGALHIMLALAIYPISGLAISYLAHAAFQPRSSPSQWVRAGAGTIGGLLHTLSIPLAIFTSIDTGPIFTTATTLVAIWIVLTGMTSQPTAIAHIDRCE